LIFDDETKKKEGVGALLPPQHPIHGDIGETPPHNKNTEREWQNQQTNNK
jgi:hypothetical protein